jgi:pantetheine-phosphate adenylyltransferase
MHNIWVYPGTFDPITKGHLNIIDRSAKLADELIVSIAIDIPKTPLFSLEQRVEMVEHDIAQLDKENSSKIKVEAFSGLLIDFARKKKASAIVRGLRAVSDFEYEFQLATTNMSLSNEVDTILLPAMEGSHFISSSMVKEVARLGGDVSRFVSPFVRSKLSKHFGYQH